MPATVKRNTAIAVLDEKEHLAVPCIGVERPAVRERYGWSLAPVLVVDRGAIFHRNCAHVFFSLVEAGISVSHLFLKERLANLTKNSILQDGRLHAIRCN